MSGRPERPYRHGHDDLLGLDDNDDATYNTGQPPPVGDQDLLREYNISNSSTAPPRVSTSHDNFVGASSTSGLPGGPGHASSGSGSGPALQPPMLGSGGRKFSQTSDLNNYQRYSDIDDNGSDTQSVGGGYYAAGGGIDEDNVPGLPLNNKGNHRSRNSILSLGGGMVGKVKNTLGMGPQYSEMDLPLTEQHADRAGRAGSGGVDALNDATTGQPQARTTPGSKFKFGLPGRNKVDPATLGPRVIHLNNPPANASARYVDNHVSTTKYNIVTFLPKFLYEQFSKYANLFFLFTAIIQQIPNLSPTNRYTTIVPLGIVLLVSAVNRSCRS